MARPMIVAQFLDYSAAHHALCELIQAGILPNDSPRSAALVGHLGNVGTYCSKVGRRPMPERKHGDSQ